MVPGFLATALSMVLLAQLTPNSSYWAIVFPAQILLGLGMGTAFTPGMNLATYGVQPQDAGVASAMLNTSQQVGGSIGTAVLNTIAASATAGWIASHAESPAARAARSPPPRMATPPRSGPPPDLALAAAVVTAMRPRRRGRRHNTSSDEAGHADRGRSRITL